MAMIGFFPITVERLCELKKNDVLLVGLPYEGKKLTKKGSAKVPKKIRQYSTKFSGISTTFNLYNLPFNCYDLGNINLKKINAKKIIAKIWQEQAKRNFRIISIGGDHSITYFMLSESKFGSQDMLVNIDAHADLAREYPQSVNKSHATVFYNLIKEEIVSYNQLIIIGGHSFSHSLAEYNDIEEKGLHYFSTSSLTSVKTKQETMEKLQNLVQQSKRLYVSLDLDVLSRAFVPSIDTAEFFGFTPIDLQDVLAILLKKTIYIDIVEGRYSKRAPKEQETIISIIFEILANWSKFGFS